MENVGKKRKANRRIWSNEETIVPILFGSYCFAYLIQVYSLPSRSTRYPYLLMLGILILFVFIVFQHVFARATKESLEQFGTTTGENIRQHISYKQKGAAAWKLVYKPTSVMIATFVYPHIMTLLGFTFTTFFFLFILLWIFGTRRILTILAISIGFPLGLFLIMTFYLKINLPAFGLIDLPLGF
jgi:hypothetical protein